MCVCVCGGGGGGGGQMTHAHVLLQLGYEGVAVSSSIRSREEHITLYFNINPYFNKSKSVWNCAYSTCTQIKPIT